jgi:hypothetical protein
VSVLEFVPPPLITAIRKRLEGIRILAPTGVLGTVPEEKLEEAVAAGAVVMTPEKMREMRQAIFMEHTVFDEKHAQKKPVPRHRRKSLWKQRGR